jgi:hypothetical protein
MIIKEDYKRTKELWRNKTVARIKARSKSDEFRASKYDNFIDTTSFYQIVVRSKDTFTSFKLFEIYKDQIYVVNGLQKNGIWCTHCWLVNKTDAKIQNNQLVATDKKVINLLHALGSMPQKISDNIFKASDGGLKI